MKNPYVAFYPSDWLAGTRGMSAAETGVYITLIAMMYEREEPLAMDHKRLARLCGTTPATFARILETLIDDGKVRQTEQGLWNFRVEKECKIRQEKSTQATAAANAKWKKTQQNQRKEDADASDPQCGRNANHNHNHISKKVDTNVSTKKGSRLPDNWEPSKADMDFALKEGLTTHEAYRECDRFRDYWHGVSGQRGVKKDWPATWRNWVRNSRDRKPRQSGTGTKRQDAGGQLSAYDRARLQMGIELPRRHCGVEGDGFD